MSCTAARPALCSGFAAQAFNMMMMMMMGAGVGCNRFKLKNWYAFSVQTKL
jgi:hypothetical protein